MIRRFILSLLASIGLAGTASAAIVPVATGFGADTATRDTDTGLEWLDFDFSFGLFADVESSLAPGGSLEDWRRATTAEVVQFWSNAGITVTDMGEPISGTMNAAQVMATDVLMDLVGTSNDGGGSFDFSTGYTAEAGSSAGQQAAAYLQRVFGTDSFISSAAVTNVERSTTLGVGDTLPSWLVREVAIEVSAPANAGLLAFGLFALAGLRRRAP